MRDTLLNVENFVFVEALLVTVGYYIGPAARERGEREPVGKYHESLREGAGRNCEFLIVVGGRGMVVGGREVQEPVKAGGLREIAGTY